MTKAVNHMTKAVDHMIKAVGHMIKAVDHIIKTVDHMIKTVDHMIKAVGHMMPVWGPVHLTSTVQEFLMASLCSSLCCRLRRWRRSHNMAPSDSTGRDTCSHTTPNITENMYHSFSGNNHMFK